LVRSSRACIADHQGDAAHGDRIFPYCPDGISAAFTRDGTRRGAAAQTVEDGRKLPVGEPSPSTLLMDAETTAKTVAIAFSSEVNTGSREENASKQESKASILIQSEPKL
jgi:hypothetical protein